MDRKTLVTNAIIDKLGSNTGIYSSDEIIMASGISDSEVQRIFEQTVNAVSKSLKPLK